MVTEITLFETPPLYLHSNASRPFEEIPPRCRVPQAFDHPTNLSSPPAGAVLSGPQGRRKNDPFSPQARWGDDGARQVQTILQTVCSTSLPQPDVARQFPAPHFRLQLVGSNRGAFKPRLLYVHTAIEIPAMNVDMDTDDWLGCPTPLEMYQHQCSILVDELVETERMLRRARENIAGLVQMNDLLMAGKADAEERLAAAEEKISMLEQQYSFASVQSVKIITGQRDHLLRENQRLLVELSVYKQPLA